MHHAAPSPAPIEHYENFPVASWLCPTHLRPPITAIYHFARTADDLADEGDASAEQRLKDLQDYRQDLVAACTPLQTTGFERLPNLTVSGRWPLVFGPLQVAIKQQKLPVQALHDLLDAFEQDIQKSRDGSGYTNQAALLDYCRRSANPVGRLLLHLYGVTDEKALQQSDAICTALQLINFWQDPSVDIPRGRYYITDEDCARHDVLPADMRACRPSQAAARLIAACVKSARAQMQNGAALVHVLPGRAGWELRLVVQGGLRILDKIEALHFDTLRARPHLKWWDFPVMLWRTVWM